MGSEVRAGVARGTDKIMEELGVLHTIKSTLSQSDKDIVKFDEILSEISELQDLCRREQSEGFRKLSDHKTQSNSQLTDKNVQQLSTSLCSKIDENSSNLKSQISAILALIKELIKVNILIFINLSSLNIPNFTG